MTDSPRLFRRSAILFQAYWSDPVLARDFDILVRAGRVQEDARQVGRDTPAGWFDRAAFTYSGSDPQGYLARSAFWLVSAEFSHGDPQ
jgi:hypothetical protein